MFEVIGFILCVCGWSYVTFVLGVVILCGGEEFSPTPLKHYWILIPMVIFTGWVWYIIWANAPFTLT